MKKTLEDYMNDPDIINESPTIREIHAIRFMIHDEIKDMTVEERMAYFHEGSARFLGQDNTNPSNSNDLLVASNAHNPAMTKSAIEPASPSERKRIEKRVKEFHKNPDSFIRLDDIK